MGVVELVLLAVDPAPNERAFDGLGIRERALAAVLLGDAQPHAGRRRMVLGQPREPRRQRGARQRRSRACGGSGRLFRGGHAVTLRQARPWRRVRRYEIGASEQKPLMQRFVGSQQSAAVVHLSPRPRARARRAACWSRRARRRRRRLAVAVAALVAGRAGRAVGLARVEHPEAARVAGEELLRGQVEGGVARVGAGRLRSGRRRRPRASSG